MSLIQGKITNETVSVVRGNKRSVSIDIDFGSHTSSGVTLVESVDRVATSRPLVNIGLDADSSADVLDTFSETVTNTLHFRNVKFFM